MEQTRITRQELLLGELAQWLCRPNKFRGHQSKDYDIVVISKEGERPAILDYPFPEQKAMVFGEPIPYKDWTLIVYQALPLSSMNQNELSGNEIHMHSWYHHQVLQKMLLWADEMFIPFLNYVIRLRNDSLMPTDRQSQTVYYLLNKLIDQVDQSNIRQGVPLVPDLFTFQSDTSVMSHKEEIAREWFGGQQYEHRFTYMFSHQTSRTFAEALLNLLRRRYSDQLFINSLDDKSPSNEISTSEKTPYLPEDVNARMDFLEGLYLKKSVGETHSKKYKKGQLLFLFKILEQGGIIHNDRPKEQVALAISILTGISLAQVYKMYPHHAKMDRDKLFPQLEKDAIIEYLNEIGDDAIAAISKGQKNYTFK